jgi:hypothetical protein
MDIKMITRWRHISRQKLKKDAFCKNDKHNKHSSLYLTLVSHGAKLAISVNLIKDFLRH